MIKTIGDTQYPYDEMALYRQFLRKLKCSYRPTSSYSIERVFLMRKKAI